MSSKVTFQQLEKTLNEFGFEGESAGSHVIFRHSKTGALVTLPSNEQRVRPIYVSTAARQIANSGIASTDAFEKKLAKFALAAN